MALEFSKTGRNRDARLALEGALRLDASNFKAWMDVFRVHLAEGAPQKALYALQQGYSASLDDRKKVSDLLTLEDRRGVVLSALEVGENNLANLVANRIATRDGEDSIKHLVRADCLAELGRLDETVAELEAGTRLDSASAKPLLFSTLLQDGGDGGSPDSNYRAAALNSLKSRLGRRAHAAAYFALKTNSLPWGLQFEWANALQHDSTAPLAARLLGRSFLAGLPEDGKYPVLALDEFLGGNFAPADRASLAREFLNEGNPSKALVVLSRLQAINSSDSFRIWLRCTVASGNFSEAKNALQAPSNPLGEFETALELHRLFFANNQGAATTRLLETITASALKNPAERPALAGYLAETGRSRELSVFLASASQNANSPSPSLQDLIASSRRQGDLNSAIASAEAFHSLGGENSCGALADTVVLSFIAGKPRDPSALRECLGKNPGSVPVRVAFAFCLLAGGDSKTALSFLRDGLEDFDVRPLDNHMKVALVSILHANGFEDGANRLSAIALAGDPFPAEIRQIRRVQTPPRTISDKPATAPATTATRP